MIRSRYPGYDVMQEADEWDERTRAIVEDRLKSPEPLQFFKPDEAEVLMAAAQVILAEDDEWLLRKVVELIDRQFDKGEGEGYRPQTQPKDGDLWRAGLASLGANRAGADHLGADRTGADHLGADRTGADHPGADRTGADRTGADRTGADRTGADRTGAARTGADLTRPGADFVGAPPQIQTARITALQGDDPIFFQALHKELLSAYCSLPPIWSFMGYGGPAFPRGYVRIELGARDPWEAKPAASVPALPPDGPPLPPGAEQVKERIEP